MPSRRQTLASLLALTVLPNNAWSKSPMLLRFGVYSQTIFNLPIWVALEQGFFADAGVPLELNPGRSMDDVRQSLLDGSGPLALLGPELAFIDKVGLDRVRIIAGNANSPPHFLIAQPRFHTIADLRGATFGVISEEEGTTFLVRKVMSAAGIAPSDYKIAAVGSAPARVKLLDDGVIDAALQPFPLSYEAEAKGFTNLGWIGLAEPEWQFTAMLANRKWLDRNLDLSANVLLAMLRGRRFMEDQPEIAVRIALKHMTTTPSLARRALEDTLRLRIMDRSLRWSDRGLSEIYATLQQAKLLPSSPRFRVTDFVDARPLDRALRNARDSGALPS